MTPKLRSLRVRDFRSISGDWLVPLDADVVLIHGHNGAGKTSLLSALELAATGRISYLDRLGDASYQQHLNHRGTHSGEVKLEITDFTEGAVGTAIVAESGIDSRPLLNEHLAETFVERCLLPQATLSRLFEMYTPKQNASDTPLMRFVKEILGLDALDALIDGLYPAGHISRAQKLSTPWQEAASRIKALEERKGAAERMRSELLNRLDALNTQLAYSLDVDISTVNKLEYNSSVYNEMQSVLSGNDSRAAAIQENILKLEAIESLLTQENLINIDPNDAVSISDLSVAEARYEEWRATRSRPLEDWFKANVQSADEAVNPKPPELLRALRSTLNEIESGLAESRRKLESFTSISQELVEKRTLLSELDDALAQLSVARDVASSSSAATALASALVSILEHVDGEVCPVCDQDFHQSGSLRAHVNSKVHGLNADAARLVEMEARRASLEAEQKVLISEIADYEAIRLRLGDPLVLYSELHKQEKDHGDAKAVENLGEAGQALWDNLQRLRDASSESARRRSLLERCLADMEEVAANLGASAPRGLLAQQIASLRAQARGQLDELGSIRRLAVESMRRRDEAAELRDQVERASISLGDLEAQLIGLSRQVDEAAARKQSASELRRRAEEVRTAITTRVFNEQLNGSWSRIFGALVPTEPFVPQFRNLTADSRRMRIDIETRHRDGLEGATPAAMLSQGNLNTAALSLFIALHFAVQPRLPWLIFDDPVQSMDDLHISNFASLVKQLTRLNGRQVLIAVHDRELFDYLTLELSPASPNEELLAVTIDRTYGQSVITHERILFSEDTAILPNSAA